MLPIRVLLIAMISLVLTCPAMASTVSTLAGSGVAGISDGPAHAAEFVLPTGLAWDSRGNLYIADAGAQRIRVLRTDGIVSTIAGSGEMSRTGLWVPGGYVDGAAASARFDLPMSVAVGRSGEIYVADTLNDCIRILQNGKVATLAGRPGVSSDSDGPVSQATFRYPTSIAIDRSGNLYVVDFGTSIRKITPQGIVSTLQLPIRSPYAIAVSPVRDPVLFVSSKDGLWVVNLTSFNGSEAKVRQISRYLSGSYNPAFATVDPPGTTTKLLLGEKSLGFPFAVTALDDTGVVFTDVRTHTVRYLSSQYSDTEIVGGSHLEDAANVGGGFRDGSSSTSLFASPMGVAAALDGTIAVADTGNKRIRLITALDRGEPSDPVISLSSTAGDSSKSYRIAYIGNSYVWNDVHRGNSIAGIVQDRLAADHIKAGKRVIRLSTVRMGSSFKALEDYVALVCETHSADAMVLQLDDAFIATSYNVDLTAKPMVRDASMWQPLLEADLKKLKSEAAAAGIPLLIVWSPMGNELNLSENVLGVVPVLPGFYPPDGALDQLLKSPFARANVNWLDLWPAFMADERSSTHRPIVLPVDYHLTPYGDAIIADQIARRLELDKPWK